MITDYRRPTKPHIRRYRHPKHGWMWAEFEGLTSMLPIHISPTIRGLSQ